MNLVYDRWLASDQAFVVDARTIAASSQMLDRIFASPERTLIEHRPAGRVLVCDAAHGLEHAQGAGIIP